MSRSSNECRSWTTLSTTLGCSLTEYNLSKDLKLAHQNKISSRLNYPAEIARTWSSRRLARARIGVPWIGIIRVGDVESKCREFAHISASMGSKPLETARARSGGSNLLLKTNTVSSCI